MRSNDSEPSGQRPRLALLRPADLQSDQKTVYEAIVNGRRANITDSDGHLLGPLNAMLYSPQIGLALQALGAAIRFEGSLPGRGREIAILAVAAHNRCEFEWSSHESVARALGLRDREIDAIRAGRAGDFEDPLEREVLSLTRAILSEGDLADADYSQAQGKLGANGLVELTTLIGYYSLLALQLRIFRVPSPP